MATYVNNLRLKEITTGDEDGTWGTSTNTNLELITDGFSYGTKQMAADANETFTMPDATADDVRSFYLKITSAVSLTATREITLGPNTVSKVWMIENATSGSQIITIKQGSGATVNVPNGSKVMIVTDGAGAGAAVLNANPTEVGGTVTSVGGTGTVNGLTLTGTVTTSGNLTLGGTLANVDLTSQVTGTLPIANGGTGSTSTTYVDLTTNVTGTLPVANGGTGVTSSTGTGSVVLSSSPTLTTPNLGTPSAATLTNATGLPLSTGVTGQLPLANGGTGASLVDPNADRIFFWDDSAGATTFLTVGSGLQISGTTLSSTDAGGTVTSVAVSGGTTGLTTSGGPVTTSGTITLAGTLAVANGGTGSTTASGALTNFGLTATATELNYTDGVTSAIQTQLNAKQATITGGATSITSSNLTVSRALVSDGSGKVAVSAVTSTEVGYLDGVTSAIQTQLNAKGVGSVTSVAVSGGTTGLTTSGGPITGSGTITLAGTLAVANGGTGTTTSTGSGSVVLSTAPTFAGLTTTAGLYVGGTAAANLLDDYEEGIWTPLLVPQTGAFTSQTIINYVTDKPRYTKIGNLVMVSVLFTTYELTKGTGSGNVFLGGLPFEVYTSSAATITTAHDFLGDNPSSGSVNYQSDKILLKYRTSSNGEDVNLQVTDLGTNDGDNTFILTMVYRTQE
jgi:hypothetical protein